MNGRDFKSSSGADLNSGSSDYSKPGTALYWAECEKNGDESAIVAAPKPIFKTLEECYKKLNPYRKPLIEQLGFRNT